MNVLKPHATVHAEAQGEPAAVSMPPLMREAQDAITAMVATGMPLPDALAAIAQQVGADAVAPLWRQAIQGGQDSVDCLRLFHLGDPGLADAIAQHPDVYPILKKAMVDAFWSTTDQGQSLDVDAMSAFIPLARYAPGAALRVATTLRGMRPSIGVTAALRSDDMAYEAEFDITPWLRAAMPGELEAAITCGWSNDYGTDAIAYDAENIHADVARVLAHCQEATEEGHDVGFSCVVDAHRAAYWIAMQRPSAIPLLTLPMLGTQDAMAVMQAVRREEGLA